MKKLRVQFGLFFVVLVTLITVLVWHSYEQIQREEFRLWQGIAENTFNQMQANISELLIKEDARSFSEYRYYYVPETQLIQQRALNISPLATLPVDNNQGLIGYFQINPDGSFHTPYLPDKKDQKKLIDLIQRKELHQKLNLLTQSLQDDIKTKTALTKPDPSPYAGLMDLAKTTTSGGSKQYAVSKKRTKRKSIYPNPLSPILKSKDKTTNKPEGEMKKELKGQSKTKLKGQSLKVKGLDDSDEEDLAVQVESNIAQYQTFTEQTIEPVEEKVDDNIGNRQVPQEPSIFTDPFRARLIDKKQIIFYRRIWANQKMYIQGYILNISEWFKWLMQNSFRNSRLFDFAKAELRWEDQLLAHDFKPSKVTTGQQALFHRFLGYPLNQFSYQITYRSLLPLTSRTFLHLLTLLLVFIATIGLYIIYRSAAAQVFLSQKRQDFVSAITHELKTPLTSIRLYSEMLNEGWAEGEAKKKEYYSLINSETDRLSRLIENVLHLSRLEKRNYNFNFIKQNPKDDFNAISLELRTIVEKAGFKWSTTVTNELAPICYDPDALRQVLYTLIDNSIKFSKTAKTKSIDMSLNKKDNQIIWTIADRGPGIPKSEQGKIFDKFYRIENEMTRKTKGTGIGLAMAKMLVEGMGAKIEAMNRDKGGLIIALNFPIIQNKKT